MRSLTCNSLQQAHALHHPHAPPIWQLPPFPTSLSPPTSPPTHTGYISREDMAMMLKQLAGSSLGEEDTHEIISRVLAQVCVSGVDVGGGVNTH